jgi:hypothetical protein
VIFGEDLIKAIVSGRKTVTRRRVKPIGWEDVRPCHYRKGGVYAVQPGRGKKGVAQIEVTSVELSPLGAALEDAEANREGFDSGEDFRHYWLGLYGELDEDQAVWRIEFELIGVPARLEAVA